MRDQYAGDISDILKIAFLRALAENDRMLGVAWYYAPGDDGRPDGKHLEWQREPAWQRLDLQLHSGLLAMTERTVAALQSAAIWPHGTLFRDEPIPSGLLRDAWGQEKRLLLDKANIIFIDPDNGLGKKSRKHATLSEVQLLRRVGRAIIFITFPGRTLPDDVLVQKLHERLRNETGAKTIITLRTNVSVPSVKRLGYFVQRQRWLTVIDPDQELVSRAHRYVDALRSIPRVRATLDA
jgi:hypothetical protein